MGLRGEHSITEVIGEVTRALVPASSETEIEQRVCEQFSASELYSFAWIGRYTPENETVMPSAAAGIAKETVDEATSTADSPPQKLADEAVETLEVTARQNLIDDSSCEDWREQAQNHGYRSYVVIPLSYEETLHGVLHLASNRPQGFGTAERESLAELGKTIAYACEDAESSANSESTEPSGVETELTGLTAEPEQERRLYETIISSTPDLVYAFDLDYRFIFANDALLEMWGQSLEESIGKTLEEIGYEPWHAEMHKREIDQVVETKEPVRGEVGFEHAELGERIYDYIFAPVLNDQGEVEAIAGTTRDITERKETEEALQKSKERFRALVTASSDVVYRMSPDWNEMQQLEGQGFIPDTQEPTTDWLDKYIHPDDQERVREAISDAIRTKSTFELEHRVEQADGTVGWTFSRAVPMLDEDGDIVEWIGMATDITERREREQRLEELVERLEESNERLEQFAYAVSHDLQEPLRMVTSYLTLIERRYTDDLDDEVEEFIEFAVDGAERMREMIDGLLAYSRVETQGDPFEPVDLDDVLADVRENLQLQIEEHDAEISAASLPTVRGDESQLRQVFQNLVDNAIQYSGDEPPRVHIAAERVGSRWQISVEDNGIGIGPEDADRIFEVFQRLHSREDYEGTGIGLALCRRIVERHGGDIWVEGEPGEGTTFFFTLPEAEDGTT